MVSIIPAFGVYGPGARNWYFRWIHLLRCRLDVDCWFVLPETGSIPLTLASMRYFNAAEDIKSTLNTLSHVVQKERKDPG